MVGTALKDCRLLERPGFVGSKVPVGVGTEDLACGGEVGSVVGAKAKPGTLPCPACKSGKKIGSDDAMFPMAALGPWVRKQNEDIARKPQVVRQRREQQPDLRVDPRDVCESESLRLSPGARQTVREKVDAEAEFAGVRLGVCREEVPVPAANFQGHARPALQTFR